MKNEILLIPDKPDSERDSIANSWENNGGDVLRIGKFWEKPEIGSKRITIYGNDTFCLVLAQVLGIDLVMVKDELIGKLDSKWIKRKIELFSINRIGEILFPTFIKPVKPKIFKSKVYDSLVSFKKETEGIDTKETIIRSDIVTISSEVRAFILNREILDMAVYEGKGNLNQAKLFLTDFLNECHGSLPNTFVIDLGYNDFNKWFIIELNSSWGAGLNSCHPDKVIKGIRAATIN